MCVTSGSHQLYFGRKDQGCRPNPHGEWHPTGFWTHCLPTDMLYLNRPVTNLREWAAPTLCQTTPAQLQWRFSREVFLLAPNGVKVPWTLMGAVECHAHPRWGCLAQSGSPGNTCACVSQGGPWLSVGGLGCGTPARWPQAGMTRSHELCSGGPCGPGWSCAFGSAGGAPSPGSSLTARCPLLSRCPAGLPRRG